MFDSLYLQANKLRFPEAIEKQFLADYHSNTIFTVRLALVLGLVLYSLFGILDIYAVPISKDVTWLIRYAIVAPIIIIALIATYLNPFQKYIQAFMGIASAVSGLNSV